MRHRELIERKLSHLEGIFINLQQLVKTQQPIKEFINTIEQGKTVIEETKAIIEMEPMTSEEWNNSKK
jgi:hypothetical protein